MKIFGLLFILAASLVCPAQAIISLFGEGYSIIDYVLNPTLWYYISGMNYFVADMQIWLGLKKPDESSSCLNNGRWYKVGSKSDVGKYEKRLENCFIYMESTKKAYLIGGLPEGDPALVSLDIYDPFAEEWTSAEGPGVQMDHFQCVSVDDKIWIVAAWTGRDSANFEDGLTKIVVYDPQSGTWDMTRDGMPESRRRGGAAVVADGTDIYVMFGNQGGHEPGTSVAWADKYDTVNDSWTELIDGTYRRDHTGGGLVNGKICVAGGRITALGLSATVLPTECYDPQTGEWSIEANIPGRGSSGSVYGITCDGQLMVAGGEYKGLADTMVYTFDGSKWTTLNRMRVPRHATHLAYIPDCNQMVIAAGSGKLGSGLRLSTTDVFFGDGKKEECVAS